MDKYIQPKMKVLALPEVMQNLYETSTDEEQLAKPNVGSEDSNDGWGMRSWEDDHDTWDEE